MKRGARVSMKLPCDSLTIAVQSLRHSPHFLQWHVIVRRRSLVGGVVPRDNPACSRARHIQRGDDIHNALSYAGAAGSQSLRDGHQQDSWDRQQRSTWQEGCASRKRSPFILPAHGLCAPSASKTSTRSEEHTSELQSPDHLVCRLLLEKKKKKNLYT